jgi:hypothetical protein
LGGEWRGGVEDFEIITYLRVIYNSNGKLVNNI